jgi:hypothetical protein
VNSTNLGGTLTTQATATGGEGALKASVGSGGVGGNATASATGSNATTHNVSVTAIASGGPGGLITAAGATGGAGGTASILSASGSSTGGAPVFVTATQIGGGGGAGNDLSAISGNGSASSITDRVSGSTSGALRLSQEARGGGGGSGGGTGGHGGSAVSHLTASNPGGGTIDAEARATGGPGGNAAGTNLPGNGGAATATINLTNNNTAKATAHANAGPVGNNFSSGAMGTRGPASATAHATTTGGFQAEAIAFASGSTGSATALAETSSGIVTNMALTTSAPSHPLVTANARGSVGGSFSSLVAGINSHGVALPIASDVTSILSGDPNVTAFYNSPDGKTPLALVALALNPPGSTPALSTSFSASASFSFDVATLQSGNLLVGLLDPTSSGPDFTSLHFSIAREGAIVEDQTFTTMAAATTYFNDNPLNLGAVKANVTGALDLTFLLEMTSLDNGARYNANFLVADVGLVMGVDGDYNDDGKVDAADYVVWRKNEGTMNVLPNDPHGGTIGALQFNTWRANFGNMAGSGTGLDSSNASVPEPAMALHCAICLTVLLSRRTCYARIFCG